MELYQLKTFVAVAEEGLLTRAAERLHSSQPAISAHIKALEAELGISLFDRTPKGMRLTAEGEQLKVKALAILDAAEELSYTAKTLKGIASGNVRLGLNTEPDLLRIADILTAFKKNYPKVSLSYSQKMSWEAPKEVALGNLDAAFMYTRPDDEKIQVRTLDQLQLVLIAPMSWRDRLENSKLEDLAELPWVWADERCPLYKVADGFFAEMGREPAKAVIVDQESAITRLVSSGVGLSLMPEGRARDAALAGQLYISDIPAPKLDLSLIYLKSREHDPVVQAILEVINHIWPERQTNKEFKEVQMTNPLTL